MLKKASRCVLTSLRGSTYGLGKRLFPEAMGGWVKTEYDSPHRSLWPCLVKRRVLARRGGWVRTGPF